MFDYVTDKEFISKMRGLCGDIMQDLCHCLKEDYDIGATFYLVGSGARNLITQNASEAIDLDYNLELVRCDLQNERDIKENVRKAFNQVLAEYDWSDCEDSAAALTTEKRHFTKGNNTEFSMDYENFKEQFVENLKEEVKRALAAGVPKATILTYFYPEVTVERMISYRKKQ